MLASQKFPGAEVHARRRASLPVAAVYDRRRVGREFGSAPKAFASRYRKSDTSGAALMLSLWALFLLSAMVISWALDIDSRLILSSHANRNLEAEAMACSGSEIALHPNVRPGSPLLHGSFAPGKTFEARLTGEGGRLNLKWLLTPPDAGNPRLEVLRKYLEVKGVDLNERDRMIDCLLDWVDPDNLEQLNGAEESPGYKPPNRPLLRLDELKRIKGWEEFTSTVNWDSELTLSSSGPIDIAWAPRDVILALPGMDERRVDQFLELRRGPDEIDGTEDDGITTLQQAEITLGFPPGQLGQLGVVFKTDQVMRIVSVGKSGEITRTVRMVVRKTPTTVQLIPQTWKEL